MTLVRYAIKKVVFRGIGVSNPRAQAVMREVQCLAQLDHKNIVRYHTSWLESSWVENGMGYQQADSTAAAAATAAATGATAATAAATTADNNGADVSLRARMDALVPAHMQSQLIRGLESMVRTGDSASGSGSGWGWGAESDGGFDGDAGFGGARRSSRNLGSGGGGGGSGGGGLLWGSRGGGGGGDRRGSMSPQLRSPKNLIVPLNGRDRGFSRWSAEDLESETSRWSEASSYGGLDDADPFSGGAGGGGAAGTTSASAASSRVRGGGGAAAGAAARSTTSARRWVPQAVRTLRSEQFRNPSIDMDDLVSFGNSSSPTSAAQGVVDDSSCDDNSNSGWREWDAAAAAGGIGRGGGDRHGHGSGGGRGRGSERRLTKHSVSPDRLVQYPVSDLSIFLINSMSRLSSLLHACFHR